MKHSGIGSKEARYPRPEVTITCRVCGTDRTYRPGGGILVKTCSPRCAEELKSRTQLARHGDRKGARNPNFRHGTRSGVRDRAGERRWYAVVGGACAACSGPGGVRGLTLHHIVYRQHVRTARGDEWDPLNALTLCDSCHSSHHQRGRVLAVTLLPDAALDFAFALLGPAAFDYFRRYYGGHDPRLDERLASRAGLP